MKKWIIIITALLCVGVVAKFQYFDKQQVEQKESKRKKPAKRDIASTEKKKTSTPSKKTVPTPDELHDAGMDDEMVLLPEPKAKKLILPNKFDKNSISPKEAMSDSYLPKLLAVLIKNFNEAESSKDITAKLEKSKELRLRLLQWQLLDNAATTEPVLRKQRSEQETALKKLLEEIEAAKTDENKADLVQTKMEQAAQMRAQIALPTSFAELFENETYAKVFQAISADTDFLEKIFYSGEPAPVVRTMTIFGRLVSTDSDLLQAGRRRDIAEAISIEYSRFNWDAVTGVNRGKFFLRYYDEGRFHKVTSECSMALLRLLVGAKGNHASVSVNSMQWYVDNAHMPQKYYVGFKGQTAICWRCGWRRNNLIGDSIHRNYYETYSKGYGDNFARQTLDLGGVCGAVSSFGAGCAIGNGIPAMTMGEPGHCAYTVLVDGKWTPAYSLSWKRNLHWHHWDGVNFFSSLQIAHDMYESKAEAAKTERALELCAVARCMEKKNAAKTSDLYRQAIEYQPKAYPIYRDYLKFLGENPQGNTAAILLKDMCQSLTKEHPEMAAYILQKNGMPVLDSASAAIRSTIVTDFWKSCEPTTVAPWDMGAYLTTQADWIGKAEGDSKANIVNFYGRLLAAVIKKPELAPAVMSWASTWSQKQDEKTQEAMSNMALKVIKAAASKGISMDVMLGKAILNAEILGDIDSFNTLNKMVDEDKRYVGKMPEFEPFPGELVSAGGLIRASSSEEKHDTPLQHAGVLTAQGGMFHTGKDKDAYVVVEMPRLSQLSGIVFIPTTTQPSRQRRITVQVSETGADDSWEDVQSYGDTNPPRVVRLDLSKKKPRARFVRLLREGGPDYFHLNGIYVYGKRSS